MLVSAKLRNIIINSNTGFGSVKFCWEIWILRIWIHLKKQYNLNFNLFFPYLFFLEGEIKGKKNIMLSIKFYIYFFFINFKCQSRKIINKASDNRIPEFGKYVV